MNKTQIAMGVAAAFGLTSAHAVVVEVSLVGTVSESNMGPSTANVSNSTATWMYDTVTDILTASGLYKEQTQITPVPGQLFTHNVVNMVVGNMNAAAATSYSCVEGSFGGLVGASLCGNYNFGSDGINDSTASWGPGTAFSKTLGGDDGDIGPQQDLSQYDGMSTSNVCGAPCTADGAAWDGNTLVMSNAMSAVAGYAITLRLTDWAMDDGPLIVPANATTNIDVLANDQPFTGNIVDLTVTAQPGSGSAAVNGTPPDDRSNLSIDFTAPPGFSGTETFTYEVTDDLGIPDSAIVTVIGDELPNAVDDNAFSTGAAIDIDVLANDDLGNAPDSMVGLVSGPTGGGTINTTLPVTCTAPVDCSINFTPSGPGVDTFVYELTDANGDTDTATVTISTGSGLVAVDDNATTEIDTPVVIDVLANELNIGPADYTVDLLSGPASGTVDTVVPVVCTNPVDCSLQYSPAAGQLGAGEYTFVYEISNSGAETDSATVTVFVNDVPVANDDASGAELPAEILTATTTGLDVQANDTGLNDAPISAAITTPATNGTAVFNAGTGEIDYTSNAGYVGMDTFGYTLTDSRGNPNPDSSNEATVTLTIDDEPVANDDGTMGAPAFMVEEGTTSMPNLDVLANDTGLSDTPMTVTITTPPALGTATVIDAGGGTAASISVQFDANPGAGPQVDSFVYQITDNSGDQSSATAWVAVTDADFPMAMDDTADTFTNQSVDTNVLANDAGLADEPLVLSITTPPANGMTAQAGCNTQATCLVTYTPMEGFAGTDTYEYMVSDADGDTSNVATVTVTVNPIAIDDDDQTFVDTAQVTNVLANDVQLNEPLTVTITTDPANGSTAVAGCDTQATCEVTYTPAAGFIGTDSYEYIFTDSMGDDSNVATVTMTVNEVPVAEDDEAEASGVDPEQIPVLANDAGLSFEPLTVTISQQPMSGTATVNGSPGSAAAISVTYTSDEDTQTIDEFEYTVTDNNGQSSSATVTVNVTGSGGPIPPQETVPGSSSSLAFGPFSLLAMSLVPLLRRLRRRR